MWTYLACIVHVLEKDEARAVEWYIRAARQGEATAQRTLGQLGKSW